MLNQTYTEQTHFFGQTDPQKLLQKYGSPLYVYNESILRTRCREIAGLSDYPHFHANYSVKANGNLHLLRIIREEGFYADAMSPGEIYVEKMAGFQPEQILFISNNVSPEEMRFAIDRQILVSVDSLSQLTQYGCLNPGSRICIRFNPMVGAGHSDKVVTGGKNTKFGVDPNMVPEVKAILARYQLRLVGINQHIGSLFMEDDQYIQGMESALAVARQFANLEFIDFGGGFGIPYRKQDGEKRLDLTALGKKLHSIFRRFAAEYGKELTFKLEPGRYIVAECGVLLGTVTALKSNFGKNYLGTDIGFNVLQRPLLYGSHHDMEVYRPETGKSYDQNTAKKTIVYQVTGNICESGDILAADRALPEAQIGDILTVLDAGAYGYCMASSYNNRLRPAEVLITNGGEDILIRRRETLADLVQAFPGAGQ